MTDAPVSSSSVGVLGEGSFSGSECEFVEPQSNRGMSMEDSLEQVPPLTRRKVQEVDCGVGHGWAAVYQAVAKRMLDYLDNSEVFKVNTRELEFHVLAPK